MICEILLAAFEPSFQQFTQLPLIRQFGCQPRLRISKVIKIGHRPWRLDREPVQQQACLALDQCMEPLAVANDTAFVTTGWTRWMLANPSDQARQHVCYAFGHAN